MKKKKVEVSYNEKDYEYLIGMDVDNAFEKLPTGINLRVVKYDNYSTIITCDLHPNRLNVEVENDLISKLNGFY